MKDPQFHVPPGFTHIKDLGMHLVVRPELADQVAGALHPLHQAWALIHSRAFSARGRAGVVSIPLGGDRPNLIVRRYVHGGLLASVWRDLYPGPARALTELAVAETARAGGVRTPRAVGVLASPAFGPLWKLAFITEEISNSEDLVHYCCRLNEYPPETAALEKRGVIGEAAAQIRKMHELGIFHADLHLKNLLLRRRQLETPEVYIIDFDRASACGALSLQQRFQNLKRLARSVRKVRVAHAVLTDWDRLRLLRAYLRGMPNADRLLRKWARKLANTGSGREAWWTLTRAQRTLRGDAFGRLR